jgi:hypothetical protein
MRADQARVVRMELRAMRDDSAPRYDSRIAPRFLGAALAENNELTNINVAIAEIS